MEIEIDPLSTELITYNELQENNDNQSIEIKVERMVEDTLEYESIVKSEVTSTETNADIVQDYQFNEPGSTAVKEVGLDQEKEDKPIANVKDKKRKEKKIAPKKKKRVYNHKINEDIQEEENPNGVLYYACSVCEVKYTTIERLYNHVLGHKNRLTSWDLRVKNLKQKKKRKKELKRLKKAQIKQEDIKIEVELELATTISEFVENYTKNGPDFVNANQSSSAQDNVQSQNTSLPSNDGGQITSLPGNEVSQNTSSPVNINQTMKKEKPLTKKEKDKKMKEDKNGVCNTELDETQREALNLEKIFKCGHCNKQFHLGYYLKLHVRSHTGEKPYSCEECGISFITASKLGRHRKRTHLSVRFVCRVCRRPYTRLEFLTRHFNKQHQADKIEGEPYDYNAILPYLKELEEELEQKKKKEAEEAVKREDVNFSSALFHTDGIDLKPKAEELWGFNGDEIKQEDCEVKEEVKIELPDIPDETGQEDSFTYDGFGDVPADGPADGPTDGPADGPVAKDGPAKLKDEDQTDDEYFPSDTWLPSPSPPPSPPPKPAKGRRKRSLKPGNTAGNPLQCSVCKKVVSTASYLRIHMRTHTGDKPFKCYLCSKSFITSSKRNRHVMTHSNWEEECKDKLENGANAEVKEEPDEDDKVLLKLAKKSRLPRRPKRTLEKLSMAEKRDRKKPFACRCCCSRFGYPEALQLHMHSHQSGEKPGGAGDPPKDGYMCRFCLEVFEQDDQGRQHELSHEGPKPYLCTICGRTYKKKETMVYHRRHHDAPNKYQCDVCPKTFNLLCKLQRHLHSHRPGKFVVRYECPVCAHIFNTRYHIEMHLTTHEKEGVILQENRGQIIAMVMQNARKIPLETDKATSSLKNLVPTDERSRICNICGEIFSHFYDLEQHLKTHGSTFSVTGHEDMDERKYICQICNKGFKLSYYLKLHSYTHTKEKPFVCQQCGKGFITRGKLKRHLETHTGLKKFQCHICCKYFTRPSYLRIHVRTIHGNQDYNFKQDVDYEMGHLAMGDDDGMQVESHGHL